MADNNPFLEEYEDYAVSSEAVEPVELVHIDGKPYWVHGDVQYANLAVFQPHITIGDPTKESDQILSVWIQSDWTGGGQIEKINESSDIQRFRYATAETRYPNMLTLPPETTTHTSITTHDNAYPIGDYAVAGTTLYWCSFDEELAYFDTATQEFIAAGDTLTDIPVNKSIVYDGKLWIPQGASGYDVWDGATTTHFTDILPVSFVEWDDKLVALETTGQVSTTQAYNIGWNQRAELILKGDRIPRHLVVWWNQERQPTVFIVTNRDVWAVDFLVPVLYRTGLRFPVHPDHGLGATAWRDDAMYVSAGVGVHQLSLGGVVSPMGLDHDDGLPGDLRGAIVDMEPEYNGLLALVQGLGTTTFASDTAGIPVVEETMMRDASMMFPHASLSAKSTLQRWTSIGWHTVWESASSNGVPTRVQVSEADGEYRLWWGYAGLMHSQLLRRSMHNPKQGAQLGIDRFAPSASLQTGRFDANMEAFSKLASNTEVQIDPLSEGRVDIYCQTDMSYPDWNFCGTVSDPGTTLVYFDGNGDGWPEGESFKWMEFRYDLFSTDPLKTPIIQWITLKFIKIPLQTRSWTLSIPLQQPEQWEGRGAREMADDLDALASGDRFITFKHRDQTYRVRVSQVIGGDGTGFDLTSDRRVSLIEIA
jgi:hypothetical protein